MPARNQQRNEAPVFLDTVTRALYSYLPTQELTDPKFPLKGPFEREIDSGTDIDVVDMDIDSDMAV